MSVKALTQEVEAAIAQGEPFGSSDANEPKPEVPAETLRELICDQPESADSADRLWLRRVRITEALNLEAQRIGLRLVLESCEIEGAINLHQAQAADIKLIGCILHSELIANQIDVRWNLQLNRSKARRGVSLGGAKIGGHLSMLGATLEGKESQDGVATLNAPGIEVGGDMPCEGLTVAGEVRLPGAKIGGHLSMLGATLEGKESQDGVVSVALSADGFEVGGNVNCDEFRAAGEVRLPGAKIGGQLLMRGAKLEGQNDGEKAASAALSADSAEVRGDMFCDGFSANGEVRLHGAKIGGQLSMNGATLEGREEGDKATSAALNADGLEVDRDMFCEGLNARGAVRLPGAKIGGQLLMRGAKLEGKASSDDSMTGALSADHIEVGGSMFCDGLSAVGKVRLLGAKIGGQLSMNGATLEGREGGDGTVSISLAAHGAEVGGDMFCKGLSAVGEVRLPGAKIGGHLLMRGAKLEGREGKDGAVRIALNAPSIEVDRAMSCDELAAVGEVRLHDAKIGGQLSMNGATLMATSDGGSSLNLVAAEIDELILAFEKVDGTVDLREAAVRSLWDAEDEKFAGQLPEELRLEGFSYRSLREPLDAKQRLRWIGPSQREHHYPGVYAELADAFRRIGHSGDARTVAIANERRARQDARKWGFRRAWHDLLWVTVGYGYRDWLAALWLLGLIGVGAALFSLDKDSFVATTAHPPAFNPIRYAVDTTIPVLDIGQTRAWSATGYLAWVGLILVVSGYALVAAVVAAAAGVFSRNQAP